MSKTLYFNAETIALPYLIVNQPVIAACYCCGTIEVYSNRMLEKSFYKGCSKMRRCKARTIMRNEAYFLYAAKKNDARNAAAVRFSTAC